jgi:hypothetical protein
VRSLEGMTEMQKRNLSLAVFVIVSVTLLVALAAL